MLAAQWHENRPRGINSRTVRAATERRIARKSRARYAGVARAGAVIGVTLALLMCYVVLMSSLTGLSYAISSAAAQREALQEETMRLDDRIAALRSDERLSALAGRLGMSEPQHFAVIRLRPVRVAATHKGFALFSSLGGLFVPTVARRQ
ncbi:MAG: hypothetical protein JO030_01460 [Candidatus Eremiobacteraeota bacterium]|nr:hypothetical protein [Candidatus Eremiobacteraeota bacterium]